MKIRLLAFLAVIATAVLPVSAAELAGKWSAAFDSQIGQQTYTYEFKQSGDQLSGTATFEHQFGKGTVELKSLKVDGAKVSFTEALSMQGNEITITYSGTLAGDELKLTRQVGEFATEELVAKRETEKK